LHESWTLAEWDVERLGDDLLIHGFRQPAA